MTAPGAGQDLPGRRERPGKQPEALLRAFPGVRDLEAVTKAMLGGQPGSARWERLRGGSKKRVCRLAFDNQSTVVIYVWAPTENYWPAQGSDSDGPFSDASEAELFEASRACRASSWNARDRT